MVLLLLLFFIGNVLAQEIPIKSLSLKEALRIAKTNNPQLLKANHTVEAARGRYYKDISPPSPEISLSNEFVNYNKNLSDFEEKSIEISQNFDFPILYFSRGSRATKDIETVYYETQSNEISIKASIIRNYYNAAAKLELVTISNENLIIAEEFSKKADIRFNVGEGTNLETLSAKLQLSEAKSQIHISNKEYLTALTQLLNSIGLKQVDLENIKLSDTLNFITHTFNLKELIQKSEEVNPLIKKAASQIESARIGKSLAWMSLFPSFGVSYMFQNTQNNPNFYGFKIGMSIPIWFMMDQKGQMQEADANYEINSLEMQSVQNNIIQQINSDYLDFQSDISQLELYIKELIPQANEFYRSAKLNYEAGEISYLEFLQAKMSLISTKSNYVKSLYDYNEAVLNLEEAVGNLNLNGE